ncbi:HSP20-like chaperone [Cystobasidium minutum MCA 4210]|uniref:HSP20-like chaperone n=1 Tax=Cystobasidium minutum MCA 4210 TaxID=1397322 RepID=UPI0034CDC881|eukprot:jgi/Rhomi1/210207/estExt_Genemark1.C_3_t20435
MSQSTHPAVYWAQRSSEDEEAKNILLVTIEVADLDPESYSLEFPDEGSRLVFKGKTKAFKEGSTTDYAMDVELFDKVLPEKVKKSLTGKSLYFTVPKKELKQEYWPRLTKDKKKTPFIKTDFDKWVDEDEQDAAEDPAAGDLDMSGGMPGMGMPPGMMGGAGGAPGAGGFDMEALMKQMGAGGAGGMPDFSQFGGGDDDGEDDGDMPALESKDGKDDGAEDDMPSLEKA